MKTLYNVRVGNNYYETTNLKAALEKIFYHKSGICKMISKIRSTNEVIDELRLITI